jgi:predicted AAA+ superfamily ATPase
MELQRFNYQKMLKWKSNRDKSSLDGLPRTTVLQLEGPKRSGKTYLAKKFGAECYKRTVYWDVSNSENDEILSDFRSNIDNLVRQDSWSLLFSKFDPVNFVDSPDTLVIIDEIQDSVYFYNSIRQLRECKFHVLASGSYLGVTRRNKMFFHPGDDVTRVLIPPLTFREFLFNLGKLENYNSLDLTGKSPLPYYEEIQEYWDDYMTVGGYPNLVLTYMVIAQTFSLGNHSQILALPENAKIIREKHKEIDEVIRLECEHYMKLIKMLLSHGQLLQALSFGFRKHP